MGGGRAAQGFYFKGTVNVWRFKFSGNRQCFERDIMKSKEPVHVNPVNPFFPLPCLAEVMQAFVHSCGAELPGGLTASMEL